MVDLPGLFLAGNKDQSDQDAAVVEALVLSYMRNPRTIILAVVSAKSDFALQQVTRHARVEDPKGTRTLGLITKPDTLDQGSDSERFYINLAQNKDVDFRLGWHVLRNRNFAERNESSVSRDAAEVEFFSKGVWKSLKPSQLGVAALRVRLSHVLQDQILRQLPKVLEDVSTGIGECKNTLEKLGTAKATLADQRRYLLRVSMRFSEIIKAAVDGVYTDVFFKASKDRRIRAVMQNTLADFSRDMRTRGHAKTIVDGPVQQNGSPNPISRSAYITEVKELMTESRGRELPGTYSPLIVAELFSRQCKPWQGMVRSLLEDAFQLTFKMVTAILHHAADRETAESLLRMVVKPAMDAIKKELRNKADEILEPHLSGHPITYNHYLTDNVQKAQADRRRRQMEGRLKQMCSLSQIPSGVGVYNIDLSLLLDDLASKTEPDMDTYSCSMAVNTMEAYYKVRLSDHRFRTVITNHRNRSRSRRSSTRSARWLWRDACSNNCPAFFLPMLCGELSDDVIQRVAGESDESVAERVQANEKLLVLENAFIELKRLGMHGAQMADDVSAA